MFLIKTMLKVLIVLPIVAWSSFKATWFITGAVTGGVPNIWVSLAVAAIVCLAYLWWDGRQESARFKKHALSLGVHPEYTACYGDNGLVIDKTNETVFAGKIKHGRVFAFHEISSIQWEDGSVGSHRKYILHIHTKDFDFPKLSIGFASNRAVREEAYAKLRAALNIA